jgi:hypothetical protein
MSHLILLVKRSLLFLFLTVFAFAGRDLAHAGEADDVSGKIWQMLQREFSKSDASINLPLSSEIARKPDDPLIGLWKCEFFPGEGLSTKTLAFGPNGIIDGPLEAMKGIRIFVDWSPTSVPSLYSVSYERYQREYALAYIAENQELTILTLSNGTPAVIEGLVGLVQRGYSFQDLLKTHPDDIRVTGKKILPTNAKKTAVKGSAESPAEADGLVIDPNDPIIGLWESEKDKGEQQPDYLIFSPFGDTEFKNFAGWYRGKWKKTGYSEIYQIQIQEDVSFVHLSAGKSVELVWSQFNAEAFLSMLERGYTFREVAEVCGGVKEFKKVLPSSAAVPVVPPTAQSEK